MVDIQIPLFGAFTFQKKIDDEKKEFVALPEPKDPDGALEINSPQGMYGSAYAVQGNFLDYQTPEDEVKLITKYRELSLQPEIVKAVDDIVNEAFTYDDIAYPVKLEIRNEKINKNLKKKMGEEFQEILRLLDFNDTAYEVFKRWYVDGRLYYEKIVEKGKESEGLKQLRYIDPRKIKKIRRKKNDKDKKVAATAYGNGIDMNNQYEEFYLYNPSGIQASNPTGVRVAVEHITYVHSGLFSKDNKTVLSHLHQAIRYFNALRNIEDALVIYRLTRAPERRIFNIETGQLPPMKAQSYLKEMMDKFRKKLSYDPTTGAVAEQNRFLAMQEDFWFLKQDGKGSSVETLAGGQNLSNIEDAEYFKKKLYESLNVPITRMDSTSVFMSGRSSEITRDEIKFSKFINRLRKRFNTLFVDLLKTQLLLKGIIKETDWAAIEGDIVFDYVQDNNFAELRDEEIYANRFNTLATLDNAVGVYISKDWVAKNILRFTDEDWEAQKAQMKKEDDAGEPMPNDEDPNDGGQQSAPPADPNQEDGGPDQNPAAPDGPLPAR